MIGTRPAWGLYVRGVNDLNLRSVSLGFEVEDGRPALVIEVAAS